MSARRLWLWWVAAGAAATTGYYLVPRDTLASNLIYNAIGFSSALMILVGVRWQRPRRPAMWYWFAAGQGASAFGDLVWEYNKYVLQQEPYPSMADAFYLVSYPLLAVGLVLAARVHGQRGMTKLVEAGMIGTALGLVFWIFVLHPTAAGEATSATERIISTAYPAADALLLAILAGLVTGAGGRTASARLVAVAAVLLLAADVAFSVITLHSDGDGQILGGGWLLSYVLWAAAALHPSMAAEPAAPAPPEADGVSRTALGAFTACSLLAPGMLFWPGVGADPVDRMAIGIGATVLFLLVIARMSGLMRRVQGQAAELRQIAMRDDLTGLPNRRLFEHALREALRVGRPQVAFVALSGFKNVNDELGRPIGDQVLGVLAARIAGGALPGAIVARMGGDEFAVLVPDGGGEAAAETARRLTESLREPVRVGDHELLVGAGIGLADGDADAVEVLRRAEVAMYAAKSTGEPYRHWLPALDERAGEHARLGAEIRAALDGGQFRVVYQPIVQLPEGRVAAVEALVRWDHPQRGPISPAYFIPVAEQNGLIVELGAWILETACARLVAWRAQYGAAAPERVSVNVSARQLARPGFAVSVAQVLLRTGLPPQCLTVEVTETAVFEGGRAVSALHELRSLGVRIALDDFGTGHSSLGLLQSVPVDILKVDKSFVDSVTEDGRHAVIVEGLIHISAGLGLTAVAEGVETAEQAEALYRIGYRLLQGYHYGRPVAEPDFSPRLARLTSAPARP